MLLRSTPVDRVVVLDEDVFQSAIHRERRRADRFDQQPALLILSLDSSPGGAAPDRWAGVINAVSRVKRPSDLLGWMERGTVLGIFVPEIAAAHRSITEDLIHRFRAQLEVELGRGQAMRVSIQVHARPAPAPVAARAMYPALKRTCDVLGSATCLMLFAPALLIVAAMVKLTSKGPVLFRQPRIGHREQPFTMLKFRTMRVGADPALHKGYVSCFIQGTNTATTTGDVAPFKIVDDPRVTRVGALLRKTSLDELPQLLNVLRGDMSLVGPRPPLDYEVEQYAPWHRRRVMDVKPGITGLWQVTGRSCTTFEQMVRLDLRYAKTCSLRSDLKILFATPAAVISGKGAR
jgi:lipopolysaccharide/colanic/teichoic acid biosynthesis glycosyltransferase